MSEPAPNLEPPYWAVVFTSQLRHAEPDEDYERAAARMEHLAAKVPGFIGVESARNESGFGLTVSYWKSEEAITTWRNHTEHLDTQARGRADWYARYELRVARVERTASFPT